tara:strand:+ start:312 stop:500 length:189 start_codon:yes stop_codon:yes gene_type:complete
MIKYQIIEPKNVLEAVNDLYEFLHFDLWYACNNEWKTEKQMQKYLKVHFDVLIEEIKVLSKK